MHLANVSFMLRHGIFLLLSPEKFKFISNKFGLDPTTLSLDYLDTISC